MKICINHVIIILTIIIILLFVFYYNKNEYFSTNDRITNSFTINTCPQGYVMLANYNNCVKYDEQSRRIIDSVPPVNIQKSNYIINMD